MPAISVIMAVYNTDRYLRRAVLSILQQTFLDFEFIIVDDGSTDRSPTLLRAFAGVDRRVNTIRNSENRGVPASLNRALAAARAPLTAVMDSDDVALPNRLLQQLHFMQTRPEVSLLGTQVKLVDPYGFAMLRTTDLPLESGQIQNDLLKLTWPIVHPTVVFRTEAARDRGGYDSRFPVHHDHDLFLKLSEAGELANLPEVHLLYRRHGAALTARKGNRQELTTILESAATRRGGLPELRSTDSRSSYFNILTVESRSVKVRLLGWAMADVLLFRRGAWRALVAQVGSIIRRIQKR